MCEEEEEVVDLNELRHRVNKLVREIDDMCYEEYESESVSLKEEEDSSSEWPDVPLKSCAKYRTNNNFLVPWTNECKRAFISVTAGRNFWHRNELLRTTFLRVQLHPKLPCVHSRICNETLKPLYNFEHAFDISELSFDGIVPVIEVCDYIEADDIRVYAVAYVSLQCATEVGSHVKILDNAWIPIVTPVSRILCGSLNVSLTFVKAKKKKHSTKENKEAQDNEETEEESVEEESSEAPLEIKEREDVGSQTTAPPNVHAQTQTFAVYRPDRDPLPGDLNDILPDIDEWGFPKPPLVHRREPTSSPSTIEYCDGTLDESSYRKYKDFDWGSLSFTEK